LSAASVVVNPRKLGPLGFARELEAAESPEARSALFDTLVSQLYERGKATEAASFLEIDAVIDPAETRGIIASVLARAR